MGKLEIEDRLLDVDGRRVALRISGAGAPPVVCLSSAGGAPDQWAAFVPLVQPVTTCIAYGRPGLGGSDPIPAEMATIRRGGWWAAEHLHAVLQAAEVASPYPLTTVAGLASSPYSVVARAAVPDVGARPFTTRPSLPGAYATILWSRGVSRSWPTIR